MTTPAPVEVKTPNTPIHAAWSNLGSMRWTLIVAQVVILILFAITSKGGTQVVPSDDSSRNGLSGYFMFSGVEIMMFVGFGYLMTFMKWYGVSAVGFTMLITAIGLQWAVLTEAFFHQLVHSHHQPWHYIDVDIYALLDALFAISAVLITFGALIGIISPLQLTIIAFVELALHSVNFKVILGQLYVTDMGGTYIDHMFGAYFGLALSYMLPKSTIQPAEPADGRSADIFSLIGTVFLWVYWPSFVSGAAEPNSAQQQTAIVNTILALSASTIAAFAFSTFFEEKGRLRPVDIQNATLAGGVSIGSVANLSIHPAGAIAVGLVAGIVSTWGFNCLSPKMAGWGIHDTCGIHNLHASPSVVGALASVIVCAANKNTDADIFGEYAASQWWRQLVGMFATMGFAIVTGMATGFVCNMVKCSGETGDLEDFHDGKYWKVSGDYVEAKKKSGGGHAAAYSAAPAGEIELKNTV